MVKAAAEGAGSHLPPMDVLDMGRFALLTDPTGAPFGLWQARSLVGAELVNEPGGIVWTELLTRNTPRALAFYGALFGYAFEDMSAEGFDYHAFSVDDRPRGGNHGHGRQLARRTPRPLARHLLRRRHRRHRRTRPRSERHRPQRTPELALRPHRAMPRPARARGLPRSSRATNTPRTTPDEPTGRSACPHRTNAALFGAAAATRTPADVLT
ncbi:hypothetical protein ACU686_37095 [Yinghuangia aomiensis]